MPARIGANVLLLARGGRQNLLGDRLQARPVSALTHHATRPAITPFECMSETQGRRPLAALNAIAYQRVSRRDRLSTALSQPQHWTS
jgi:hypothetical protein